MTYNVFSGTLNPTQSVCDCHWYQPAGGTAGESTRHRPGPV